MQAIKRKGFFYDAVRLSLNRAKIVRRDSYLSITSGQVIPRYTKWKKEDK